MSGAGKSQATRCLEDLGFFCVDNLPPSLIPTFAELCAQSEKRIDRVGLVIDVRERAFLDELFDTLLYLRRAGHQVEVVFFDASDEGLVRRFSESRRPHPLVPQGSVVEGIRAERQLLARVKAAADLVIDTTPLTIHELRKVLTASFQESGQAARTAISLLSFGYKHGLPFDADLMFDARFLPNPQFQPALRDLSGQDAPVIAFLEAQPLTAQFLGAVQDYLAFSLPHYVQEGKAYLTIAIGCTGGRHRSVYVADRLADWIRRQGQEVTVRHRDRDRT
jgi:RNase adapter protein RapZ